MTFLDRARVERHPRLIGRRRRVRQVAAFAAAALLVVGIVLALGPSERNGPLPRSTVVAELPGARPHLPEGTVTGVLPPIPKPATAPPPPPTGATEPVAPALADIAAQQSPVIASVSEFAPGAPPPPLPGLTIALPRPTEVPAEVELALESGPWAVEPAAPPDEPAMAASEPAPRRPRPADPASEPSRLLPIPDPALRADHELRPRESPAPRALGPVRPGTASIALIIDDIGPARALSARAIALPGPLTMAILPYSEDVAAQARAARQAGHEVFLHMPMQPIGDENPGRNALLAGMSSATLSERLEWAIGRVESAVGMNNHMGSRLTSQAAPMAAVMEVLRRHGLMFVDSRTTQHSVAAAAAAEAGLPHTARDVFLDHFPGAAFVRRQLAEVEDKARASGVAVAIGHPLPATLDMLEHWIPEARAKGFRFIPVSAAIAARGCDGRTPAGKCGLLQTVNTTPAAPGG